MATVDARGRSLKSAFGAHVFPEYGRSRHNSCRAGRGSHKAMTAEQSAQSAAPGSRKNAVQRFWQTIQAESHAKRKDHGSDSRKAEAAEEVAELRIQILSATKNHTIPQHQLNFQTETADHFFREKGAAAPALIALSLLNSALSTFGSGQTRDADALRATRGGPGAEDWSAYQKYDVFHHLLTSSPLLKRERFAPLQALLQASPRSGPPKYDFIRSLLRGINNPQEHDKDYKWDLVGELLRGGRQAAALQLEIGDVEKLRKYDMVFDLLHAVSVHADWQLPTEGLAHNFLHFDDWGSREYDPVTWVFENAWHDNPKPIWDPLAAMLGAEAPTLRASWDPLAALLRVQVPSGKGLVDPIGDILRSSKEAELQKTENSKYDPLPGIFGAQPQPRGENDSLGNFIRSLTHAELRDVPDAVRDILKGLLAADFSHVSDPVGDILAGLNRFADFRSAPDIGGLTGKTRGLSHYFPDLLAPVSAPTRPDAFANFLKTLQVPGNGGQSKYDPLPAVLSATGRPSEPHSDPVMSFLKASLSPPQQNKYDPLSTASPAAEISSSSSTSTALPQVSAPVGASKYDPLPGLLSADVQPPSDGRWDLLRGLLRAELPSGNSKFDPLPALLSSELQQTSAERLDIIRSLLKTQLPTGDSKFDPVPGILSSEPQQTLGKRPDILRALLKTELPIGDSKFDPLPGLMSSEPLQNLGERPDILRALLRAELPSEDSKYDPLPKMLAAEPGHKRNALRALLDLRLPAASSKFDPLKDILRALRKESQHHKEQQLTGADSAAADQSAADALGGQSRDGISEEARSAHSNLLSHSAQQEAASSRAASTAGIFDPSFVRALKGQFSEAQSPETGFPLDARDPRLRPTQKANLISQMPVSERPFAAGSGKGWLEEASSRMESSAHGPAVAKLDAVLEKTEGEQIRQLRNVKAENMDKPSNAKPTAGAVSPNPIQRLLGRWPWWSSEGKAQTAGKMQPSERPFAKDARKKGWLEEASTPLGEIKPPKVPEHYQQPPDRPPQIEPHIHASSMEAVIQGTEITTTSASRELNLSAEARSQAVSKLPESERPFARSSSCKGWLETASRPLETLPLPPSQSTASRPNESFRKQTAAGNADETQQSPSSDSEYMSRTAARSTVAKGDGLAAEGNGAKTSEVAVGKSGPSWTQAAGRDVPDNARADHDTAQSKEEGGAPVTPLVQQQGNLAEFLPGVETLPPPKAISLSAQLRENKGDAGKGKTVNKGPYRLQKPHPQLDSLQAQWQYLQQQSEGLSRKFPADKERLTAHKEERRPASAGIEYKGGDTEKQRQSEALQRQLSQASKHRALTEYDLVPDIFRLRGAMKATPRPVAGYDPVAVLAKRAGRSDVNALAIAFRELAADRKLASKHAQLYRIMQASLPVPNPSRSKLTLPSFSRALPGPPSTAISAAEKDTGALLQDIGSSQKYSVLHSLLHGRRPETVVGAICALATLLQPAVVGC